MHIEFEKLLTADALEELRKVAFQVWPQTFKSILSQEQIEYMMLMMYAPEVLQKELTGGMTFELIKIDGTPSGYVAYSIYPDQPETLKLHKVYLLKSFHSLGIGQKMLDHVQKQCRELGCKNILLTVNKHNERAIRAYKRNGFVITRSAYTPIGHGFFMDDYIMEKCIK